MWPHVYHATTWDYSENNQQSQNTTKNSTQVQNQARLAAFERKEIRDAQNKPKSVMSESVGQSPGCC